MSFYNISDIIFPHLGITIRNLPMGISINGFTIAFYGITIAIAMLVGYFVSEKQAKKFGVNIDTLMDFAIFIIVFGVIGARAYYVIFHWSSFADNPVSVLNLRTGGLAIYGGVLAGIVTAVVFCKVKKINFFEYADVAIPGLLIGQVIGRWANFFNREAFGKYTDGLFAMQMNIKAVGGDYTLTEAALRAKYADNPEALEKILEQVAKNVTVDGVTYIQAHPTFLYESLWNLGVFIFVLIYAKHKRFKGEMFCWYAVLYGLGRFWIEALRTDQLFFFGTNIPVSQIVAVCMIIGGGSFILYNYLNGGKKNKNDKNKPNRIKELKEAAEKSESKVKIIG